MLCYGMKLVRALHLIEREGLKILFHTQPWLRKVAEDRHLDLLATVGRDAQVDGVEPHQDAETTGQDEDHISFSPPLFSSNRTRNRP
jgi:hypothetical protein